MECRTGRQEARTGRPGRDRQRPSNKGSHRAAAQTGRGVRRRRDSWWILLGSGAGNSLDFSGAGGELPIGGLEQSGQLPKEVGERQQALEIEHRRTMVLFPGEMVFLTFDREGG